MIPMSIKQRIALAIKAKQKASQGGGMPYQPQNQPLSSPSTMASMTPPMASTPSVSKPVFNQGAKALNPGFFKLKQKLSKF